MIRKKYKLKPGIKILFLLMFLIVVIVGDYICIKELTPHFLIANYQKEYILNYGDSSTKYSPSVCYGIVSDCKNVEVFVTGEVADTKRLSDNLVEKYKEKELKSVTSYATTQNDGDYYKIYY